MCGPLLASILVAMLAAAVSSVAPRFAAAAVEARLADAGLRGSDTTVTVTSDPPLELLDGHADRVRVVSDEASIGDLQVDRLELDLVDVDLDSGTFARVEGRLTGVDLPSADGAPITADLVELAGPADAAEATVRIAGATVQRVAIETIRRETGLQIGEFTLTEPDGAVIGVLGFGIQGRFRPEPDGGLAMGIELPGSPQVRLVPPGLMVIRSATVEGGDLVLTGTIDVAALLGE